MDSMLETQRVVAEDEASLTRKSSTKKAPRNKVGSAAAAAAAGRGRGKGFTPVEDLLVCKAWMAASEDPLVGTGQSGMDFNTTFHRKYVLLLVEQEKLDWANYNRGKAIPSDVTPPTTVATL